MMRNTHLDTVLASTSNDFSRVELQGRDGELVLERVYNVAHS